jgi:DNA polymerase III subunit epsilon
LYQVVSKNAVALSWRHMLKINPTKTELSKANPSKIASFVVVDLETTGIDPTRDRITEVAVIWVENGKETQRWTTLVNPGVSIPAEIQALTGINNSMVRSAPKFEDIAADLLEKIQGQLFVAHNARFDYGFLKHAFARSQLSFTADVLCTVRLSRRLEPEHAKHNLDCLVERHNLKTEFRHRAMGDAELLVQLLNRLTQSHGDELMEAAVKRLLKTPSLPQQLKPDALDSIPDAPGVYVFYGVNDIPLYIGKSVALRERVRSHFSNDYRTANDLRLSAELQRIETHVCAGEFGALLLEARWIGERFPALNKALRKSEQWHVLSASGEVIALKTLERNSLSAYFGPFTTKRSAKSVLQNLADTDKLCWTRLKLEKREGACFGYQVRKCAGHCVGQETDQSHDDRLALALRQWQIPDWPFKNDELALRAVVSEDSVLTGPQHHVFDRWCYVGTFKSLDEVDSYAPDPTAVHANAELKFDPHIYRLLHAAWNKGQVKALQ